MRFNILGAVIAAPMIVLGGAALSHTEAEIDQLALDTISIKPTVCIMDFGNEEVFLGIRGADGRVFVKFDVIRQTVQANCTITAFEDEFQHESFAEENFDCFVQITKGGLPHVHQILYWSDAGVSNKKRFRNGKAKLSCSGPYEPGQSLEYNP